MDYHIPVLFDECMQALNIKKDKLYFDGTLGGGGHSLGILNLGGKLIATDRDNEALTFAKNKFIENGIDESRYHLVKSNFKSFNNVLDNLNIDKIDGALLDLGISSHQIDQPERGFSYRFDGKLDMRMDKDNPFSAYDIVNGFTQEDIANILYVYGEEKFSRTIAKNIVLAREQKPIETTLELVDIIKKSVPMFAQKNGHPAKKTFQALRIRVNDELDGLDQVINDIVSRLNSKGRLAIITFHSLEDRIVKQAFKLLSTDCICDKHLPVCVCHHKASTKLLGKKQASKEELEQNKRSASATLRIVEKL